MKELLIGTWSLIWAIVVSTLMFSTGTLYSLGYSIWLSVTLKDWKAFFKFWWRLIDGMASVVGYMFYHIALGLDIGWNINGEILEDLFTAKEDTTFSQKNLPVSASVGKLEIDGDLNKSGKRFSKLLNFFFNQKQHAVDAWLWNEAREKLKSNYFNKPE